MVVPKHFDQYQALGLYVAELHEQLHQLERLICDIDGHLPAWVLTTDKACVTQLSEEHQSIVKPYCLDFVIGNDLLAETIDDRSLTATLLSALTYGDKQDPRVTIKGTGLIGCSDETLSLAVRINDLKSAIASRYTPMSKKERLLFREQDTLLHIASVMPSPGKKQFFKDLPRLNFQQIERHINILSAEPLRVGFSMGAINRSIVKITPDQAKEQLEDYGDDQPHIELQLRKLRQYARAGRNDSLRQVRDNITTSTINLKLPANTEKRYERKSGKAPTPLLYPVANETLPPMKVSYPRLSQKSTESRRSDKQLSDRPLLESIHVYTTEERPSKN